MAAVAFRSRAEALEVLNQLKVIQGTKRKIRFYDPDFVAQKDFVLDDSPRVSALCTRRAGKSFGVGLKLLRAAYREPESTCLYLGLTRQTAKRIMWKDVIKTINRDLGLNCKFNEAELTATTPNGSVIYLLGADSTKDEMEKVLGGKLKLALIDEAGSFRQDLKQICYEMIEPALADYDGTLAMVGTPTALLDSFFHRVTDPRHKKPEFGWQVHRWNTFDNPHMVANWTKRLAMLKETEPNVEQTPWFRRMYLGEWVTDLSKMVYKFDDTKNRIDALPEAKQYHYVLGIDLGFDDPSAFVLCAYSEKDRNLYIIESHKSSKMIISDVAERIRYYQRHYPIHTMVIDNAAKQSVEELKQRFGLPLEAADKQGKAEFIEMMNSDFLLDRIKVVGQGAEGLVEEWKGLIWDDDPKNKKREEHPSCPNHNADAALYAWRHCLQYLSEPDAITEMPTAEEQVNEWLERESERIVTTTNTPFWERM